MTSVRLRTLREKLQVKGDESQHEKTDSWSNRDLIPLPPARRTWVSFHYFGYWYVSWEHFSFYLEISQGELLLRPFQPVFSWDISSRINSKSLPEEAISNAKSRAISSLNVSNWQTPNTYLSEFDFPKVEVDIADSQTAVGLSVGQSMAVIVISRALIALFSTLVAWCGLKWHIGFTIQNRYTWGMRGSYIPLLQRILLNFIWTAVQCRRPYPMIFHTACWQPNRLERWQTGCVSDRQLN